MLRIHQCRSAEAAQSYYTQGLAREDYYREGHEIAGAWGGRGAGMLGLAGPVDRTAFVRLSENRHPQTGERLTQRTKTDRTVGYDFNFHAPKGLSLLHALHQDERIVDVFRAAVSETMIEIEAAAAARVRRGGSTDENRLTRNLLWAEFVHLTARPSEKFRSPDPHLHAHCFVMNATHDSVEGRWKAAQFREIVRDAPYYEAAFHNRLAAGIRRLGYHVDRTATGWDLAGLERTLIDKFSNRTIEINAFAEELGITDPDLKSGLGARTRRAKDRGQDFASLRSGWDERLTPTERELLRKIAGGDGPPGAIPLVDPGGGPPRTSAQRAMDWAVEHAFERESSVPERRLVADALRASLGTVPVEAIWRALPGHGLLSRTVGGRVMVTTPEVLAEEKAMLAFAVDGKGVSTPFREQIRRRTGGDWEVQDLEFSEDKRMALDHLLNSGDRVLSLRGAAGAGKTTMMTETVAAIRAAGHAVVVVAPSAAASRGENSLRSKGFAGADTVAKLLADTDLQLGLRRQPGQSGGVLWVDEAGLLGARTMKRLFDLAEKHDARVVLCGDERQHKSVERGDALRVLEKYGGVRSAELTSIRRQRGLYREAVAALSRGDVDTGVANLERLGAFREIEDPAERVRAVAADYVRSTGGGRSALVVSPTHAEGERIAGAIRALQREEGFLRGEERTFLRLRDTGWTEAQRQDPTRYTQGMVAHFHQNAKGILAGDKCDIMVRTSREGERTVEARTPRGVTVMLPLQQADRYQVYHRDEIRLAVGDRVRITKNGRSADDRGGRLTNGAVHLVTGFTRHGAIELDGHQRRRPKIAPVQFGHLAYGSVMTSNTAQGNEAQRVILAQSSLSAGAASSEQFYVSVSRGRDSVAIYTDSKASLIEAVKRPGTRISAIEMLTDPAPTPAPSPPPPPGEGAPARDRGRAQPSDRDVGRRRAQQQQRQQRQQHEQRQRQSRAPVRPGSSRASSPSSAPSPPVKPPTRRQSRGRGRGPNPPGMERDRDR